MAKLVGRTTAAARLMRAYSGQVETLRRLRHGGDRHVRVEHVDVNDGQAERKTAGRARPERPSRAPAE